MARFNKINIEVDHALHLAANLMIQQKEGKYCDVCICVEEKRYLAHKSILSANSPKLDSLITEAIGDGNGNQDIEIEIQGVSSVGFETLLEYIYSGKLLLKSDTVMPVWMTAAYLDLPNVVNKCSEFCKQSVASQASNDANKSTQSAKVSSSCNDVPNSSDESESKIEGIVETTEPHSESSLINKESQYNQVSKCREAIAAGTRKSKKQNKGKQKLDEIKEKSHSDEKKDQVTSDVDHSLKKEKAAVGCDSEKPAETQDISEVSSTMETSIVEVQCDDPDIEFEPIRMDPACEDMMLEVERLRRQHELLKRLHREKEGMFSVKLEENSKCKKRLRTSNIKLLEKKPSIVENSLQYWRKIPPIDQTLKSCKMEVVASQPDPAPDLENATSDGFKLVTPEHIEHLYKKYSFITKKKTIPETCSAVDLLKTMTSRGKKSGEQNSLNSEIRAILDKMEIADSAHPHVEDALLLFEHRYKESFDSTPFGVRGELAFSSRVDFTVTCFNQAKLCFGHKPNHKQPVMDRFECLRSSMNDRVIRHRLMVKIKHSLHCKKWRTRKRNSQDSQIAMQTGDGSVVE